MHREIKETPHRKSHDIQREKGFCQDIKAEGKKRRQKIRRCYYL